MSDPLAVYHLHAQLHSFQKRVERSRDIVRRALANCQRPYVSCSFGKDSLCLLHLVAEQQPGVDVIWVRDDEYSEWPDVARVAEAFTERVPVTMHVVWNMNITETYRMAGGFYVFADTEAQKEADRMYAQAFLDAVMEKSRELGCDLAFIGLRKQESKKRLFLLCSRGDTFYATSYRMTECFPLADWSARDVWAYIATHDLPYPDLYDLHPDREKARNGAMFAANVPIYGGMQHYKGQLAILKRMYPELFNKFAAEFPEVRCYI